MHGITRAEMDTMTAIQALSQTAEEIRTELEKQNALLAKLIDVLERSNN